jgi:hypothetical protein
MSQVKLNALVCAFAVVSLSTLSVNLGKVQAAVVGNGSPDQVGGVSTASPDIIADDFTVATNTSIESVTFWAYDTDNISGWDDDVTYYIYTNSGSDSPGTFVSASFVTLTPAAIVDTGNKVSGKDEYEITFNLQTPVLLSSNTTYWLGLSTDDSNIHWEDSNSSYKYKAYRSTNSGTSWSKLTSTDNAALAFQVSGTPAVPEPLTTFGSLTAASLGLALRRRRKLQQREKF